MSGWGLFKGKGLVVCLYVCGVCVCVCVCSGGGMGDGSRRSKPLCDYK